MKSVATVVVIGAASHLSVCLLGRAPDAHPSSALPLRSLPPSDTLPPSTLERKMVSYHCPRHQPSPNTPPPHPLKLKLRHTLKPQLSTLPLLPLDLNRTQLEVPKLDQFEEPEKEFTLKAESDTSSTSSEESIEKVRISDVLGGSCKPLSRSSLLHRGMRNLPLRATL